MSCYGTPAPGEIETVFDACEPLVVEVAPEASEGQLASIQEGIQLWNERAGTDITTGSRPTANRVPIWFDEAAAVFRGVYLDEKGEIVLNESMSGSPALTVTVAHEVGHAFGMGHVEDRRSVMKAGNISVEPTTSDIEYLDELWGPCPAPQAAPEAP